jgi:hypothetical protein
VLVLAAAAFTLSYDALHQLALDSRVRPGLAWLWPVVIDGTIVVALLTVLAANRARAHAGYPWALAVLFSAASVAFNIAHAPNRPVARLVFAMAPVALVLTTHLLMHQVSWRQSTPEPAAPSPALQAAYHAQVAAGERPTGAGLAGAAGVSERYGQRLLAEFTANPARDGHPNGDRPTGGAEASHDPSDRAEGR